MNFQIDRSIWRCGKNGVYSNGCGMTSLKNGNGYMCCLGQILNQLGVEEDDLLDCLEPRDIDIEDINKCKLLVYIDNNGDLKNTQLAISAMLINDDPYAELHEKERYLTKLFAEFGYTLEFIGEYNT